MPKKAATPGSPRGRRRSSQPPTPAGQVPDIDFSAALPQPSPPPAPSSIYNNNNNIVNDAVIYNNNKDIVNDIPKLKDQLTDQEMRFLEHYLTGNVSIKDGMILAGYEDYHPRSLDRKARNIVRRYEEQAGGAAKVLRASGVGEVRVAQMILKLMQDPSARTQLGATELAAKCLQMTQEQRGPGQAIQIIINTAPAPGPGAPGPAGGPPTIEVTERKALPPQTKPLQITK